ncbi:MAG: ABC transporter permease [Bacillota bacterium]|nr:ABC transporter permease [Bacillota bacterium]
MLSYLGRRLLQGVVVLFIVTLLTFLLVNAAPGGPASLMRMETTDAERQALIQQLHLDEPLWKRYGSWLAGALHGDLGLSLNSREPVLPLILKRLGNTLQLAGAALLLAVVIGLPLGLVAAMRRNSWIDHGATLLSTLGMSVPDFWLGILMIMVFSVSWHLLPPSGMSSIGSAFTLADRIRHLVMPAIVLTMVILPNVVRFARSSLAEVLDQDYIRTAYAKGLSARQVIYRHALRNSLIPVVTIIGLLIPALLGGSVIVESVFGWPGMGRLAVEASSGRDYTLVMAITVVAAVVVVVTNLLVDLVYSLIDPRIRHG